MQMTVQITMKAARVNAGLKQTEAAEALKISRSTIQNYENYETTPDVETAKRMAALYGLPVDNIIFRK